MVAHHHSFLCVCVCSCSHCRLLSTCHFLSLFYFVRTQLHIFISPVCLLRIDRILCISTLSLNTAHKYSDFTVFSHSLASWFVLLLHWSFSVTLVVPFSFSSSCWVRNECSSCFLDRENTATWHRYVCNRRFTVESKCALFSVLCQHHFDLSVAHK